MQPNTVNSPTSALGGAEITGSNFSDGRSVAEDIGFVARDTDESL